MRRAAQHRHWDGGIKQETSRGGASDSGHGEYGLINVAQWMDGLLVVVFSVAVVLSSTLFLSKYCIEGLLEL
jgi:hypothetical protein